MSNDEKYMKKALREAIIASQKDEVPVGAVVVKEGKVIAKAHNQREKRQNALAHAELIAIEKACKKEGSWRLEGCTLYVTLEPCPMCAGSGILARLDRVVYGAKDPKGGALSSCLQLYDTFGFNHYPKYEGGVLEKECSDILKDYFREKRKNR
jgi:Cytosine/adenosine deaminases